MPEGVRVRIAPSPTGEVHIGTIWVAQFVWVFARQHNGTFVLRIEDTDRERLVPGSVERIYEALAWYGLMPDEGPKQGGPFGPYIQSERLPQYREHARMLVEQGSAYYCFCSPERLHELREKQTAAKLPPRYDKKCLALSQDEVTQRIEAGESHVIRFNVPIHGVIEHDDLIRGRVTFALNQIDDCVLMKSDGFPTYHLAVVVDDHLMRISHVIRGEEWLPSVPKHLLIYKAFGWEYPKYAHMPMILDTDRKKLSKRLGATSALSFRDEGYLPEAMKNFLLLMGWRPKGDDEQFNTDTVLKQFRFEDVNPSGAIFDRTKLDWMNGIYIRKLPMEELLVRVKPFWTLPPGEQPSHAWMLQTLSMVQDRMKVLAEVNDLIAFMFPTVWEKEKRDFDGKILIPKKGNAETTMNALSWSVQWLDDQREPWGAAHLKNAMIADIASAGKTNLEVLWPLRVALTLKTASPDVFDILAILGQRESVRRVSTFIGKTGIDLLR